MYAMMMPFFGMGGDQLADSWLDESGTVDTEGASGDDGTVETIISMKQMHLHSMTYNLITITMVK